LQKGEADAVSFGQLFIANPDLVRRFEKGLPLNTPEPETFYGGDSRGYTDYPFVAAGIV
jgi:N-ethylmaleimide reductase